jgi:glycine betaine catabolism A
MSDGVRTLLAERRPGWSLPGVAYTDHSLFQAEMRAVFGRGWLFLGPSAALPVDAVQSWTVGGESILVSRTATGLHAHAGVCAHRGSRLVDGDGITPARRIVCPYHSWAYDLDGTLAGAPLMGSGFRPAEHGLAPLAVRDLAGLLFVGMEPDPCAFDAMERDVAPHLEPYDLGSTRVAARETYRVRANWKTIVENNRECYHCRANHPEFCLTNYEFGTAGDPRSTPAYERAVREQTAGWEHQGLPTHTADFPDGHPHRVARLPLKPGAVTETMTGARCAPLLGRVGEASGSVRVICMPTAWMHVNCDYAMLTRVTPVEVDVTDVEVSYLVAAQGDHDLDAVTAVWSATSAQDWELSERNHLGQRSRAYRPGPLSPITETSVGTFHDWYLSRMETHAVS